MYFTNFVAAYYGYYKCGFRFLNSYQILSNIAGTLTSWCPSSWINDFFSYKSGRANLKMDQRISYEFFLHHLSSWLYVLIMLGKKLLLKTLGNLVFFQTVLWSGETVLAWLDMFYTGTNEQIIGTKELWIFITVRSQFRLRLSGEIQVISFERWTIVGPCWQEINVVSQSLPETYCHWPALL